MKVQAVILAAGKGTRMKSSTIKVLHEVVGRTLIDRVVDAAMGAGASDVTVVLGHDRAQVEDALDAREDADQITIAEQAEQLGTGHAVWCARDALQGGASHTLILYGDVPNLAPETLRAFVEDVIAGEATLGVMTAVLEDAGHYGRIVRDEDGAVTGIVEYKDASDEERAIREINTGMYVVETAFLLRELDALCSKPADNAQNEYYLTDLVARAASAGGAQGWIIEDVGEIQGVNTRADLARAARFARHKVNAHWMAEGVTLIDPGTTYIEESVTLEPDVEIHPNVHLRGETHVARDAVIEPNCVLTDATIGAGAHIKPGTTATQAKVGAGSAIGPMAHLRPGADIGAECKVGNFVEVKKTRLEDGAKAGHLTYLGDAHVGAKANIGAGTITCNYDGEHKHRTTIGAGAFIGSNTALVAPVTVADGAYVGAGSTITDEVPEGALGVARGRQKNIEGWVARMKKKREE